MATIRKVAKRDPESPSRPNAGAKPPPSGSAAPNGGLPSPTGSKRRLAFLVSLLAIAGAVAGGMAAWPRLFPERELQRASFSTLLSLTRREPRNARALYYLGLKFREMGYAKSAYNALAYASDIAPDDAQIRIAAALASRPHDGGATAIRQLGEFLKRHPDNVEVEYTLASVLYQGRKYPLAQPYLLDVLKKQPYNAEAWHRYGGTLDSTSRQGEEAEAYERAVGLEPDNLVYRLDLAGIQSQMQKLKEAEENYRHVLAQAPEDKETIAAVGRFLVQQGVTEEKKSEGERLLVKVLAKAPDSIQVLYDLGRRLTERRAYPEAISHLEKVVRLEPGMAEGWFALARAHQQAGNTRRANELLARAQKMREDKVASQNATARVMQSPDDPQLRIHLARIYATRDQRADALEQFGAAVKLAPNNAAIRAEADAYSAKLRAEGKYPSPAEVEGQFLPIGPASEPTHDHP
jgi:tetratricopeptide (TPR) repeat protein